MELEALVMEVVRRKENAKENEGGEWRGRRGQNLCVKWGNELAFLLSLVGLQHKPCGSNFIGGFEVKIKSS